MRHAEEQTIIQLQTYLALLKTQKTLEQYQEFCYQLYLLILYEEQTCYITLGGKTIGTHTEVKSTYYTPTDARYNVDAYNRYFHTDALGSITSITDDHGTVIERRSYDAFGKIRPMVYSVGGYGGRTSLVRETTRAYTGHEQIQEIEGLIHMNARVYDSEIGRFLSADTVIQSPLDSQSYNRYSYVRNNPMMYTDPTGHSWLSKAWKKAKHWVKKHARTIGAIIAAAVVTVVAPYMLPAMSSFATTAVTGALAGAASGAVQTKSLKGALKGAVMGAVGAVAAVGVVSATAKVFNITKAAAHASSFIESGVNKVSLFKAAAHGLTRGAIQSMQGGKFKAGFFSGLASGFDVGTKGHGGFVGRTAIMGVVGGTASSLGGGKFANGAMSGAFVHMFNAENVLKKLTFSKAREHYIENSGKQLSVDASSVDLSKVSSRMFNYIGHKLPIQLFFHGNEYSSFNDALTYGGITLVYAGGNQVGIMPDYYNFEMHDWGSDSLRNLGTIGGRILNMDPMGTASGYSINFVGTATIGGN